MKKENQEQMKGNRGITLIALVVTIVVLLILAGITISTLFGDNGIISAARKAAKDTEKVQGDTQNQLGNLANEMNNVFNPEEWESTDQKYFTYTLNESTKTAKITGIKEQYQVKAYYNDRQLSQYDYVTAIKTESGEYITDVTIPSIIKEGEKTYTVTTVGNGAFGNTASFGYNELGYTRDICFNSFKIPSTITAIESQAFNECTKLKNVIIQNGTTNIEDYAFSNCVALTSVTLPDSVRSIGSYAFSGCTDLTNIIIPKSVTSIEEFTFSRCTSLENVTIPNSVKSIGNSAFSSCTGLKSVIIQSGTISIEDAAFRYCIGLTNITIPSSVTTMGYNVFFGIPSITVTVPFKQGEQPTSWNTGWNRNETINGVPTGKVIVQYQQ